MVKTFFLRKKNLGVDRIVIPLGIGDQQVGQVAKEDEDRKEEDPG